MERLSILGLAVADTQRLGNWIILLPATEGRTLCTVVAKQAGRPPGPYSDLLVQLISEKGLPASVIIIGGKVSHGDRNTGCDLNLKSDQYELVRFSLTFLLLTT